MLTIYIYLIVLEPLKQRFYKKISPSKLLKDILLELRLNSCKVGNVFSIHQIMRANWTSMAGTSHQYGLVTYSTVKLIHNYY